MIDGIELHLIDRLKRCGNSNVATPGVRAMGKAADEVAGSGTWASTLLATMRSALRREQAFAVPMPKNAVSVAIPLVRATAATLAAGSTPSTGDAAGNEMLQQVAVVRCDLDDQGIGTERKALDHGSSLWRLACATQLSEYEEKYW